MKSINLSRRQALAGLAGAWAGHGLLPASQLPAPTGSNTPSAENISCHWMPAHFEAWKGWNPYRYGDVLTLFLSFTTDRDTAATLLPERFEPADPAVVTVYFGRNRKVDLLGGRGYNMLGVNIAAVFRGKRDRMAGNYALVLWENDGIAVLSGREFLGAPKLYADIPDPELDAAGWSFLCSVYGTRLVEGRVSNLKPLSSEYLSKAAEQATPWFCWKYMPNARGGTPDLSYPTVTMSKKAYRRGWSATGTHVFHPVSWDQVLHHHLIVDGLRKLPVKNYVGAGVFDGTSDLFAHESRRLE